MRYLRDSAVIQERAGRWVLARDAEDIVSELPASVRSMVQRKVDQLGEEDRKLLAAASVQGYEFDSAVVAEVTEVDPADVEERLNFLETAHSFVLAVNEEELPDGTLSVRYRFVHVLYQNALYASLRPTRRSTLSGAVARSLETHLGDRKHSKASELALLFESARQPEQTAKYFLIAAQNASSVFASGEAATLASRGLNALKSLPDSDRRLRQELELEVALAFALRITKGNAARETGESMLRAPAFRTYWRGQAFTCTAVGALALSCGRWKRRGISRLQRTASGDGPTSGNSAELLGAHAAIGMISVHVGELVNGHDHLEQAIRFHDPSRHDEYIALYNLDPGVYSRGGTHRTLWLLGFADQARKRTLKTLEESTQFSDPQSVAFVHVFAAFFYQFCGEFDEAARLADACITLCDEHGIAQEREWVAPIRGWAIAQQGRIGDGAQYLRESLARHRSMQPQLNLPYYFALLAHVLLMQGEVEQGFAAVEEALGVVQRTGQRNFLSEL